VRGQSEPGPDTSVTLLAELLPFAITDVRLDQGGDSRFVTMTIYGAQFDPSAIVKLVQPGFAEFEPASYQVLDGTRIMATFDFRDAPHGLYDVKVINPNGATAIVPYRYLIERALEPEARVGLGGPRSLAVGDTGLYSVSLENLTNVDLPYVFFQFGLPELGQNGVVFNLPRVVFASNLRGEPAVAGVPWASLASEVNLGGELLAPGYAIDLANGGFAGNTFTAQIYPGLKEIMARDFEALKARLDAVVPGLGALLDGGPQALADLHPDLPEIFENTFSKLLEDVDPEDVGFQFHILASATPMTRDEFIAQQTDEALRLRAAILGDATASSALVVIAADAASWINLYLAALEAAGLLRPADAPPAIHQDPFVVSVVSALASGILAGPAGAEIINDGDLVKFFEQIRGW
jgi:hypothetical protein